MEFLRKLFDSNDREVQKYRKRVEKISALEPTVKVLSDEALRSKTQEFKDRATSAMDAECLKLDKKWSDLSREEKRRISDIALDPLIPEVFAVVREAAFRTLKMRPFDVQLIGGMVLHDGRIAEMKTGEGKTLTATLPIYLNAIAGHGVHLVTVNDYLSKVGAVAMGPVYHFLGLSVGIIQGASLETGDSGGTFVYDPEYRHADARYDFARPLDTRREAYLCDITYGTNNEYGFDYLRDNLALPDQELAQPELMFAIVDEVDSILIDEARTPLIISGQAEASSDLYVKMDRIVRMLKEERDYTIDEKARTAMFSEEGQQRVEAALGIDNLSDPENVALMQHASAALKAHTVYKRDVDYLVKQNEEGKNQVTIIDEFTGRLMFGRRWGDGLHQAVEAKEGVKIENENRTLATITYQNLFRLYPKLSGMTGTAKTEEDEFRKIYALDVVVVPTNMPNIRKDNPDVIFKTEEAKLRGIARQILSLYSRQQPTLVGSRSVEMSERVSDRLRFDRLGMLALTDLLRDKLESTKGLEKNVYSGYSTLLNRKLTELKTADLVDMARALNVSTDVKSPQNLVSLERLLDVDPDKRNFLEEALTHGIPHNILNAKSHEKEAKIISEAGRKGTVTIATNMAGRGVDILLGGTIVHEEPDAEVGEDTYEYRRGGNPIIGLTPVGERGSAEHQKEANDIRGLGGLFVLGCERHESRRIDNQLRGRSGRQGDPGGSRFFVSLEDELMRLFGDKSNSPMMAGWVEHEAIDASLLSSLIARAQKKVEMHFFDMRKHTLDYDDVMNVQREKIYSERRRIIQGADLRETIVGYLCETVEAEIDGYASDSVSRDEWDLTGLYNSLSQLFPLQEHAAVGDLEGRTHEELTDYLVDIAEDSYAEKEQLFQELMGEEEGLAEIRRYERHVTLRSIDRHWMEHLQNMEYLREGIGWRGVSGIDPLVLYKKEAYDMFQLMLGSVQEEVVHVMSAIQIMDETGQPRKLRKVGLTRAASQPAQVTTGSDEVPELEEFEQVASDQSDSPKPVNLNRAERRRTMKSKGRR